MTSSVTLNKWPLSFGCLLNKTRWLEGPRWDDWIFFHRAGWYYENTGPPWDGKDQPRTMQFRKCSPQCLLKRPRLCWEHIHWRGKVLEAKFYLRHALVTWLKLRKDVVLTPSPWKERQIKILLNCPTRGKLRISCNFMVPEGSTNWITIGTCWAFLATSPVIPLVLPLWIL